MTTIGTETSEVLEAAGSWRLPPFAVGLILGLVAGFVIGAVTMAAQRPDSPPIPPGQGWTTYGDTP